MKKYACLFAAFCLAVSGVLSGCTVMSSMEVALDSANNARKGLFYSSSDEEEETEEPSAESSEESSAEASASSEGDAEESSEEATRTTLNHGESSTKVSGVEESTEAFERNEELEAEFTEFCNQFIVDNYSGYTLGIHSIFENPEAVGFEDEEPGWLQFSMDDNWYEEFSESDQEYLDELHAFDKEALCEESQVTYETLEWYLNTYLEGLEYSMLYEPLAAINGYQTELTVLLATYSFYSEKDVEDYLAILNLMPEHFDDLLNYEHQKSEAGLMMEDEYIEDVQETLRDFADTREDNLLLTSFENSLETLDLTDEEKEDYIARNVEAVGKVCDAYEALADGLEELKGTGKYEGGLANYPGGKEYYAYLLKSRVGTDMTPEECIDAVEDAIMDDITSYSRIYMQDYKIFDEIENAEVESDPQKIMEDLIEKTREDFPTIGDVEYTIDYLDEAFRDTLSPACYMNPPYDMADVNNIFINADPGEEVNDLYVTLAHEGYPGHLYEANYHNDDTPYLLNFLTPTGYSEGWAEYVEELSYKYIDSYTSKMADMAGLNSDLMIAISCRAELGIHYEGWDLSDMVDYLTQYFEVDEDGCKEMYDYIATNPMGYTTYYIGSLEIKDIQKEYKKKAGSSYSLLNFHTDFLNVGPTAFEIIRDHLFD